MTMKAKIPKITDKMKDITVNTALLYEVTDAILANSRSAFASTKDRSEVSGGGKKPWRQKGTGRARVGTNRSPLWRGGGITFGPTGEQSYKIRLPKKKKKQAAIQMIVQRISEKNLMVIDKIELEEPKTRQAAKFLDDIFPPDQRKNIMVLINEKNTDIMRSFRNLKNVFIDDWRNINAYNLLKHDKILFSKDAWDNFLEQKGLK